MARTYKDNAERYTAERREGGDWRKTRAELRRKDAERGR